MKVISNGILFLTLCGLHSASSKASSPVYYKRTPDGDVIPISEEEVTPEQKKELHKPNLQTYDGIFCAVQDDAGVNLLCISHSIDIRLGYEYI
jgi:hypothetical protein